MDRITRQELFYLLGSPLGEKSPAVAPPLLSLQQAEEAITDKYACAVEDADERDTPAEPDESLATPVAFPTPTGVQGPRQGSRTATTATLSPGPAVESESSCGEVGRPRVRNEAAHVRYLLATAVPRLWRYTLEKSPELSVRAQRSKLRELLAWLFNKEGYAVTPGAPAPYRLKAGLISGRIDLLVESAGKPLLALETDWTREAASVAKLAHWHRQGVSTAWVLGAVAPTELATWREFADRTFGGSTNGWLILVTLQRPATK